MPIPLPQHCKSCVLFPEHRAGLGFSNLEGSGLNGVLVVAEALGEWEEIDGLPLRPQAPAGSVFQKSLRWQGLDRSEYTLTNIVRCRPPKNWLDGASYEREAIDHCKPYLDAVISERKPKCILALGGIALRELTGLSGEKRTISHLRGFVLQSRYNIPLVATYHPSFIARGAGHLLGVIIRDVKLATKVAATAAPIDNVQYQLSPTPGDVRNWFETLSSVDPISLDIETDMFEKDDVDFAQNARITQIQFSAKSGTAIVLPYIQSYFDSIRTVLSSQNPKWTWNGRNFDVPILRAAGFDVNGEHHDLMLAWKHCLHGDTRLDVWDGPPVTIRDVVNHKMPVTLKGLDEKGEVIPVKVIDWHRHPNTTGWVSIEVDAARQPIWCSPDHKILTNGGWKRADEVTTEDEVALPRRVSWDVINGTVLGDGYVNDGGRLTFTHSLKQEDWCKAKADGMGAFFLRLKDKAMATLQIGKTMREICYTPERQKVFRPVSLKSLAVWYGDDGHCAYLDRAMPYPKLSVYMLDNFDEALSWFRKWFGDVSVQRFSERLRGGVISFNGEAREKFFDRIAQYVHPSMYRKLPEKFRGRYNGWMDKPDSLLFGPVRSVTIDFDPKRHSSMEYCVTVDHPSAAFFTRGGLVHNCQPDFDADSRLLSLQSCTSFYSPFFKPWKHESSVDLPLYGAKDADATFRCGIGLMNDLHKRGLWRGYYEHKFRLKDVLDDLGARGLPVDAAGQAEFRAEVMSESEKLSAELQSHVPVELTEFHPRAGYKVVPRAIKELVTANIQLGTDEIAAKVKSELGYDYRPFGDNGSATLRWCRPLPFNPNSSQQLLRYIKHMKYKVPKKWGEDKETTGKDALEKLHHQTGDKVIGLVREIRKMNKLVSAFTSGNWKPSADGRVHPTFLFGTATGQLSCQRPNIQQFPVHGELACKFKKMIRAEPGHMFVSLDFRSFHARSLGWLALDEDYYKLADFDVHSFVTAHFVKLPEAEHLLSLSDDSLRSALSKIKSQYKDIRDQKAKRAILGLGFHMGVNKLYAMNADSFNPSWEEVRLFAGKNADSWPDERKQKYVNRFGLAEAKKLVALIQRLFPRAFSQFPIEIESRIRTTSKCYLKSAAGHNRWFYDLNLEEAVAFLPANIAHGHIDDVALKLNDQGMLDKFQLVNWIHDSLLFHCPVDDVQSCIEIVKWEMERESEVCENDLGKFQCNVDAKIGLSLAEMSEVI